MTPQALAARPTDTLYRSDPGHHAFAYTAPARDSWLLAAGEELSLELTVSLVIPARNEALNLPYILPQIPEGVTEVILVDGRSTDQTVAVAKSIRPDVKVVHQTGKGKGDALQAGFAAATGDIIVMMDADGSMSPREILRYVEALANGADLVTGSRMMAGGGSSDITKLRSLGNKTLMAAFTLLYKERCTDLCYGFMALWRHNLDALDIDCDGFEVETLINIRAYTAGLKVAEVPSHEARRLHGQSNLRTFRDGSRVLRTLLTERSRTKKLARRRAA